MPSAKKKYEEKISFSNKTMQAYILQMRQRSGLREKNHCTRMACPLAQFKPDGKWWGIMVRKLYANGKTYDTVA